MIKTSFIISIQKMNFTPFTDSTFVIVDFVYPLEFADLLGFNVVANNLWDFASYVAGCYPEDFTPAGNEYPAFVINDENSCFSLEYPLTVKTLQNKILNIPDEKLLFRNRYLNLCILFFL